MLGSLVDTKLERISKGLIMAYLKYYASIFPKVLRKTEEKQNNLSPGPTEYEAGLLIAVTSNTV
jgi:hypothetical protein